MPSDPSAGGSSQPSSHVERPHKPFATRPRWKDPRDSAWRELRGATRAPTSRSRRSSRVSELGSPCFQSGAHLPGVLNATSAEKETRIERRTPFLLLRTFKLPWVEGKGPFFTQRPKGNIAWIGPTADVGQVLGWSNSPEHPLDYHQTCLMYVIIYTKLILNS